MNILSRVYGWLAALGAVLLAIASAVLYGRRSGKQAAEQAEAARDAQANAQAAQNIIQTQEKRNATDAEVQRLPDAPAQQVGAADPATAAGRLDADGWTRD
jgi:Flp pilus assembly protein TadB